MITPPTTTTRSARHVRLQAITDAAIVREHLGQGARYKLVGDQHVIIVGGRIFCGLTLEAAIRSAGGSP